jgi:flagellar basal-body rod protein FlgF
MDRMIYLSMSGAKAALSRQDSLANNLANVSTNGFRAELTAFRAVPIRGDGASTRVFSLETTPGYNDEQGPINATGRNLDVAMTGKSWLAVQGLDGTEAYTRAGSMEVNSEGVLVTRDGLQVNSDGGGAITVPQNAHVDIGDDGTITALVDGQKPQQIGKLKMVTPDVPMTRGTDGLFRADDGDLAADPAAKLQSGALEGSNVSPVATMVGMIAAARQFEHQMKMLENAEKQDQQASKLLSEN